MNNKIKKALAGVALAAAAALALTGCSTATDSEVAAHNMAQDADNFKVDRRVVFFNGITDKYLLVIEGKCSVENTGNQLKVICKVGKDEYKRHLLGLSDNVSYFVEQGDPTKTDVYHYKVNFKPEAILPSIGFNTSAGN